MGLDGGTRGDPAFPASGARGVEPPCQAVSQAFPECPVCHQRRFPLPETRLHPGLIRSTLPAVPYA
jgi:hypothetical protein